MLCLPYGGGVELKIDVDLSVAQRGGTPYRRARTLRFTKKYGKETVVFDDSRRLEVIVFMTPGPPVSFDLQRSYCCITLVLYCSMRCFVACKSRLFKLSFVPVSP